MKQSPIAAGVAGCLLAAASLAAPTVDLTFVRSDTYTDVGPSGERESNLLELRHLIESLVKRRLADGDQLLLEILDVDLAGRLEMTPSGRRDVRVMRDADTPRMSVRYVLVRGTTRTTGEAKLTDIGFLRDRERCRRAEPFCHEVRMLDDFLTNLATEATAASRR